jgi:hypothetical protein
MSAYNFLIESMPDFKDSLEKPNEVKWEDDELPSKFYKLDLKDIIIYFSPEH